MTYTRASTTTSAVRFISTSATQQTITTAGKIFSNVTFAGAGSSYIFSDAITVNSAATLNHQSGTINLNGRTHSIGIWSGTTTTAKTIIFSGAQITITGLNTTVWTTTTTNLTFTPDTGSITIIGTGTSLGQIIFAGANLTYNNVTFTGPNNMVQITGTNTFANLTFSGGNNSYGSYRLAANQTVTGTLTMNGNSSANRILMQSTVINTKRTITAASMVTNGFVDFTDITAAGASSPWSNSGFGVVPSSTTNITGATPVTTYYVGGTGNSNDSSKYASTSGGTAGTQRAPLPQDTAIYNENSGTGTLSILGICFGSINMTNCSLTTINFTANFQNKYFCGDLILSPSKALNQGGLVDNLYFIGRGNYTLTTAGTSFQSFPNINTTGSYQMGSSFTCTVTFSILAGTFYPSGYDFEAKSIAVTSGAFLQFPSPKSYPDKVTLTGTGTIWQTNAVNAVAGMPNLVITDNTADKTISSYNETFGLITIYKSSFNLNFSSLSQSSVDGFIVTGGVTVTLPTFYAVVLTGTQFFLGGSENEKVVIKSDSPGTPASVQVPPSINLKIIRTNYLNLTDTSAYGGVFNNAIWYAGSRSIDSGGNSGWLFTDPNSSGQALLSGVG
jgi:hypothetical protein